MTPPVAQRTARSFINGVYPDRAQQEAGGVRIRTGDSTRVQAWFRAGISVGSGMGLDDDEPVDGHRIRKRTSIGVFRMKPQGSFSGSRQRMTPRWELAMKVRT